MLSTNLDDLSWVTFFFLCQKMKRKTFLFYCIFSYCENNRMAPVFHNRFNNRFINVKAWDNIGKESIQNTNFLIMVVWNNDVAVYQSDFFSWHCLFRKKNDLTVFKKVLLSNVILAFIAFSLFTFLESDVK